MLLRICMIGWLCIALPWSVWPQQLPAKSPVGALGIGYAVGEQAWLQTKYIYRIAIWMPEVRLTLHRRGAWERAFIGQSQLVFAEHWQTVCSRARPASGRLGYRAGYWLAVICCEVACILI